MFKQDPTKKLKRLSIQLARLVNRKFKNGPHISPVANSILENHQLHLSSTHYYSPSVDLRSAKHHYESFSVFKLFKELIDEKKMIAMVNDILDASAGLAEIPREAGPDTQFYWDNDMFPPMDAIVYHGLIRSLNPGRIVEIGSGFSTRVALHAIGNGSTKLMSIEPNPTSELLEISDKIELHTKDIKEVDTDLFTGLKENDILFIDTSHVVKLGSEVNHIYLNILPLIKKGVYIHIHDIFLPFEYPADWVSKIGIQWNEQYLVGAMLLNNPIYELQIANHFLSVMHKDYLLKKLQHLPIQDLKKNMGGCNGASLWIKKI